MKNHTYTLKALVRYRKPVLSPPAAGEGPGKVQASSNDPHLSGTASKRPHTVPGDFVAPDQDVDRHPTDINNYPVNASLDTSVPSDPGTTRSSTPDWDNVPFDVGCARCGHDLRGLSEPICPACGLEFDWADAVPIEELTCLKCGYHLCGLRDTRCPECGERFTWAEALTEHYRRKKPLFEYRWREQPLRSFVRSWRLAMHPRKLWRILDIHDPPQARPLGFTVAVSIFALFLLTPVLLGLYRWTYLRLIGSFRDPGYAELPLFVLEYLFNPEAYVYALIVLVWCASSFAALMLFRQSMRLCRVRTVQVLRVWVYATACILPVAPLIMYVVVFAAYYVRFRRGWWTFPDLHEFGALFLLLWVTWSLRQGYRHYLRMPHSMGVAVSSQIIAVLATAVILVGVPYLLFGRLF